MSGHRVLIVDDSSVDLEIISIVCQLLDCDCDVLADAPLREGREPSTGDDEFYLKTGSAVVEGLLFINSSNLVV